MKRLDGNAFDGAVVNAPLSSRLAAAALLASALPLSAAHAQEAADGASNEENGAIADIVVIGTKKGRGETLQNVAISATAVGEQQIRDQFTPSISDLGNSAPNVQLKTEGNTLPGTANFYIRGTGVQGSVPSDDPAVTVVIDGMPLGSNIGVLGDTFDLEGVEIYRGPQGTLFGRNATGGAVVIRSRRPSGEFGVRGDVIVGNYDTVEVSGSVEGPLAPNLSAKLAVMYKDRDGFLRNVTTGGRQGDQESLIVRPMLRYDNDDGLDFTLIGEYGRIKGDGPSTRTRNSNIPGSPSVTGKFETAQNFAGFGNVEWRHLIGEANIDLAGGVFTSITAYREIDQSSASDADGLSGTYFNVYGALDGRQFTQELRWSGPIGEVLDLTAGAFYFNHDFDYRERRQIAPPFNATPVNRGGGGEIHQDAAAVFAEATFHLFDKLDLVAGGRYTYEKKRAAISVLGVDCPSNPDFDGAIDFDACVPGFNGSKSWNSFTPRLGLNSRLSPEVFLFASWSRGFRSGGFNVRSTNPAVVPGPYRPEKVESFEVGGKFDLLDRKLRINSAFFYNRFDDLQRTAIDAQARQTVLNAAKATIWGLELETTAAVTRSLTLSGNLGYTNASYDSFIGLPAGAVRPVKDLWMVHVPKWAWGVSANYSKTLANGDTFSARASYAYTGPMAYNDTNTITEPSRDRVDASLSYEIDDLGLELSVFGKNLFNSFYNVFGFNIGQTIPSWLGPPRQYGVRASFKF